VCDINKSYFVSLNNIISKLERKTGQLFQVFVHIIYSISLNIYFLNLKNKTGHFFIFFDHISYLVSFYKTFQNQETKLINFFTFWVVIPISCLVPIINYFLIRKTKRINFLLSYLVSFNNHFFNLKNKTGQLFLLFSDIHSHKLLCSI
jgi:hypothetical protein